MRITNKYNLPDAIVRAVKNDGYSKGDSDYSVSDLITPPRVLALKRKHRDELEEDASDRVWSLFGQAVHHIAERANVEDIAEKRWDHIVLGKKVSGGLDNLKLKLSEGTLSDYKVSTVSKFSFSDFKDWEEQLNCYAQLLRWNRILVKRIEVVGFTRDHRPREAESARLLNKPYPQKAFTKELPLWDESKAIGFINERVSKHEQAKQQLPKCSAQDRWARADTFAVKKYGQKNAVSGHSNYASEETAKKVIDALGKNHYLEHRLGRNIRCENYCAASKFCEQFKELSKAPLA